MATARNLLLQEIIKITGQNFSTSTSKELNGILEKYRIQVKLLSNLKPDQTARVSLIENITSIWKAESVEISPKKIKAVIADYRMQLKKQNSTNKVKSFEGQLHSGTLPVDAVYKKKMGKNATHIRIKKATEALAGGPKKRNSSRGKCPKCHSLGVVLAQSSGGDGYFSCIYCGFQAYQSQVGTDLNWPLAAELLGRCFDEGEGRG